MSDEICKKVEEVCVDILKRINFKNGFANIELWVFKNGDVRIIEMNPRCAYPYDRQYKDTYGRNLFDDIIKVSMGKAVEQIDFQKDFRAYSVSSVIVTRLNGKLSELLDFERIDIEKQNHPDYLFQIFIVDPNFEIKDNTQSGARLLMRIFFSKSTYAEIEEESLRLKKALLIKDDYYLRKNNK